MKANELMVGDWLKHANGKYYRVTRIDILGDYNSIHYACGFPHLWEYNNKFEPIPLTPEILEKNGFVVESRYCHGEPLQYCKLVDGLWINISGENFFEGKLEYVHQFQHALRLCGIKKEIEL